jgi:hypothetical protein
VGGEGGWSRRGGEKGKEGVGVVVRKEEER